MGSYLRSTNPTGKNMRTHNWLTLLARFETTERFKALRDAGCSIKAALKVCEKEAAQ